MTKISGHFHASSDWPVPLVRAAVWLPAIKPEWTFIDFLLDTGAGTSSIHPLDSITRVGLPVAQLLNREDWPPNPEAHRGVGGSAIYHAIEAHYAFLQEDGRWRRIDGQIRIAEPTLANLKLPSLLGWDVLREFQIQANWRDKTISLT